jgi:hypothetical protein
MAERKSPGNAISVAAFRRNLHGRSDCTLLQSRAKGDPRVTALPRDLADLFTPNDSTPSLGGDQGDHSSTERAENISCKTAAKPFAMEVKI